MTTRRARPGVSSLNAADGWEGVVRLVRAVLGDDVVGAYPHGSAVAGGLRPDSDLDVLVVVRRATTLGQRRALVDGLLEISGTRARGGPARPVELTVVVHDEVRPWRYPPRREFQYGEWLRDAYERGETPGPTVDPDLAPLLTMVSMGGVALLGPAPHEVLDPVPRRDLERAVVAGIPDLLDELESDTRNVLLTLARIWTTLATGAIESKDRAADWALGRLPVEHRAPLDRARAGYLGIERDRWDELRPRVRAHAAYVVAAIERLVAAAEGNR
ncbi:aminoglycoside adenylyltransferase family protein [Embleya sp. NPDC055664]